MNSDIMNEIREIIELEEQCNKVYVGPNKYGAQIEYYRDKY